MSYAQWSRPIESYMENCLWHSNVEKDITLSSIEYVWICPWSPGCFVVMKPLLRTNSLVTLFHSIFLKSGIRTKSTTAYGLEAGEGGGSIYFSPLMLPVFTGISDTSSILLPIVHHLLRKSKHVQFL